MLGKRRLHAAACPRVGEWELLPAQLGSADSLSGSSLSLAQAEGEKELSAAGVWAESVWKCGSCVLVFI